MPFTESDIGGIEARVTAAEGDISGLSTVATSGSYNDLADKPTIPPAPAWGGISGTLSSQTDLQTALDAKQATLVSGTNIKTINGSSVLGSGNLVVSGADPAGYTYIVKSADQDVTNAGRTDDSEFSFSVTANARYLVEMDVVVSGNNSTGDYSFDFHVDSGTMSGYGSIRTVNSTGSILHNLVVANAAAETTEVTTGIVDNGLAFPIANKIVFAFVPSATTTFRYRFGNKNAAAGRTSRTIKGSVMKYKNLD